MRQDCCRVCQVLVDVFIVECILAAFTCALVFSYLFIVLLDMYIYTQWACDMLHWLCVRYARLEALEIDIPSASEPDLYSVVDVSVL